MRYRVVQWTTGNVGRQSVQAIDAHPDLELVGCYAWSPDKVGRDAGELSGIGPTGVLATNDVDALLALEPDCVVYNPMWVDVDEMVRILDAGVNIVTTAAFVTGHSLGDERRRIEDACARGGASVFGSGINPGFANLLAIVSAGVCDRIDKITVTESADTTGYDSPATELPVGFGRPIDDPELQQMTAAGTAVFEDAVRLIGDGIGVEFDEVVCEAEYAQTTEDLDLGSWQIPAGCVAGVAASWHGKVGRPDDRRTARAVEEGADARAGLADRLRLPRRDRRPPDDPDEARHPAAPRLRRHDLRRLHGARNDPHRDAGDQRHPCRRRGTARHRDLHRRPAAAPARARVRNRPA